MRIALIITLNLLAFFLIGGLVLWAIIKTPTDSKSIQEQAIQDQERQRQRTLNQNQNALTVEDKQNLLKSMIGSDIKDIQRTCQITQEYLKAHIISYCFNSPLISLRLFGYRCDFQNHKLIKVTCKSDQVFNFNNVSIIAKKLYQHSVLTLYKSNKTRGAIYQDGQCILIANYNLVKQIFEQYDLSFFADKN